MGSALIVDGVPDKAWREPIEKYVSADGAVQRAREIVSPWMQKSEESIVIDTLNLASLTLFLDHVAKLEGFTDSSSALDNSRWKNLPYYLHAIWLPLNGRNIAPVIVEVEGWPIQICTARGLLADLQEIASHSEFDLGRKPEMFDVMLSNPRNFYKQTEGKTLSDSETLQWIWYAFNSGARLAEQLSTPAWQAG